MPKYTSQDVRDLANAVRRSSSGVAFLTGAGCSVSAGIPLASSLVKEISSSYAAELRRANITGDAVTYGACMGILTVDERKELLDKYLNAAKVNWAHIGLASLMASGFVKRTLTFNFDSILARACGLLGLYPATYDFGVSPSDRPSFLVDSCIVHVHGQGYGPTMLNSKEETADHAEKLEPLIEDTLNRWPVIVIGYSGDADEVFPIIERNYKSKKRMYWIGFDEKPRAAVERMSEASNAFLYIGGADADAFLISLAQELRCFPPRIFSDPGAHLLDEIESVLPFPLDKIDVSVDVLSETRARLEQFGAKLRLSETPISILSGDADGVVRIEGAKKTQKRKSASAEKAAPLDTEAVVAWAHLRKGSQLAEQANEEGSLERFDEAIAELEIAEKLQPQLAAVVVELADVWRQRSDVSQLREDLERSISYYQRAHELEAKGTRILHNWAVASSSLYKKTHDRRFLEESFGLYTKCLELDPNFHQARINRASIIANSAMMDRKSDGLIDTIEDLNRIKPLAPEKSLSLRSSLAGLFRAQGIVQSDPEALRAAARIWEGLATENGEKGDLYNLGGVLLDLWNLTSDETALRRAEEVLDRHEAMDPSRCYNRACLAALLGDEAGCEARLVRAKQSGNLPPEDVVRGDPDLRAYCDKTWFKDLLGH